MVSGHKLKLIDGREITVQQLNQRLTYESWLEGIPTVEWNSRHLYYLADKHKYATILRPSQTLIPSGGDIYPFGTPAVMPSVECIGRFRSYSIKRPDPLFYSELTIIWFQAEFAMPIDLTIEREIANLHWDAIATNYEV